MAKENYLIQIEDVIEEPVKVALTTHEASVLEKILPMLFPDLYVSIFRE